MVSKGTVMYTKERIQDFLNEFNITLKEWGNKLNAPAIIIRDNKEIHIKKLSKMIGRLRDKQKYQNIESVSSTQCSEEEIQLFLSRFEITLLEFSGTLRSKARIKYSNGKVKIIKRLDHFLDRLKNKLTINSSLVSIKTNSKYTHTKGNKYFCEKHKVTFEATANNRIICPICRENIFKEKASKFCIKSKVIGVQFNPNKKPIIKAQCLTCNNIFTKSWRELGVIKILRCPACRFHEDAVSKHKFFYNFDQYAVYTRKLTRLNKIKYKNIIGERENETMHLDHKFSIYHAYLNHIPLWMCSSPSNLEYLSKELNITKHTDSSVSLSDFLVSFSDFIKVHPEYLEMVKSMEDTEEVPEGTKEVPVVT